MAASGDNQVRLELNYYFEGQKAINDKIFPENDIAIFSIWPNKLMVHIC